MADESFRSGTPADSPDTEDELEAFFRSGDDGTYVGGPASVAPVSAELEEHADEPLAEEAIRQRLERRAKYQQLVSRLMTVLGVAALLTVTVRAASSTGKGRASVVVAAPVSKTAPARVSGVPTTAAPPVEPPAPVLLTAHAPPVEPPASEPVAALLRAVETEPPPERASSRRAIATARTPSAAPRPRNSTVKPAPRPEPDHAVLAARAPLPRASASFPAGTRAHAPPTANFPD